MRYAPPVVPAAAPQSLAPAAHPVTTEQVAPTIVQRVAVEQVATRSDLLTSTEGWTWQEFRDYVCGEIQSRFGAFPRDARKEYGIFNRYFGQYGQNGIKVAQFAFGPVCDGWWGGAPVSINRFCKASDSYFTVPILQRLKDAGQI